MTSKVEASTTRRRVKNNILHDNVDVILFNRVKHVNVEVPEIPEVGGRRLRYFELSEQDFTHLIKEIKGGPFGFPSRPELEIQIVGADESILTKIEADVAAASSATATATITATDKSKEKKLPISKNMQDKKVVVNELTQAVENSGGKGIEIIFNQACCLYIYSGRTEDRMLLLLQKEPESLYVLNRAYMRGPPSSTSTCDIATVDRTKQRVWRRFVRERLEPQLKDPVRMKFIHERYRQVLIAKQQEKLEKENEKIRMKSMLKGKIRSDTAPLKKKVDNARQTSSRSTVADGIKK